MFREAICSVVLRELLDVRVAPLHCTGPVQPGAVLELLRVDEICVPLEVSVFCSSPGPPLNFRLHTNLYVRFDSLDFAFSAQAWF